MIHHLNQELLSNTLEPEKVLLAHFYLHTIQPLPLSEQGIDIFKNSLSSLLGYSSTSGNTKLTAKINDAGLVSSFLSSHHPTTKLSLLKRFCISPIT